MDRREFVIGAAAQVAALAVRPALAHAPAPYDWSASPPRGSRDAFPVGPPGAQHVLKAVKRMAPDGQMAVARSDIYGGAIIPFVPFTGAHQS